MWHHAKVIAQLVGRQIPDGFCRVSAAKLSFWQVRPAAFKLDGFVLPTRKIDLRRHLLNVFQNRLSFANHVNESDTGQDVFGGPKGFEIAHWFGHALDRTMVVFDHIVEVFDLANDYRRVPVGIDLVNRRLAPLRRQQKSDCLAFLVHNPLKISSHASDPDVGLVHTPTGC